MNEAESEFKIKTSPDNVKNERGQIFHKSPTVGTLGSLLGIKIPPHGLRHCGI